MSSERSLEPSSELAPSLDGHVAPAAADVPLPVRVQMMSTEHWSLLASRNLAWNESFSRASMFLSTLSFTVVALALVGQASGFGEEFRIFALVVLPMVLFLGIATQARLDSANHHDAQCVIGMNRIRAGYLEIDPAMDRFFVMGTTDDFAGVVRTMAVVPGRHFLVNMVSANPTLVAILNSMLTGAIVGLGAMQIGAPLAVVWLAAAVGAVASVTFWLMLAQRMLKRVIAEHRPVFPGSADTGAMRGAPR